MIGMRVRRRRRAKRMGLRELARASKVPPGYLSELEHGTKRNPSVAIVQRLARALGVSVTALLS